MIDRKLLAALTEEFPGICETVSLSEKTTWRIGGPALQITIMSGESLGEVLSFLLNDLSIFYIALEYN